MSDGFDDDYKSSTEEDLTPSNTKIIPKRKTAVALKESEGGKKVPPHSRRRTGHYCR